MPIKLVCFGLHEMFFFIFYSFSSLILISFPESAIIFYLNDQGFKDCKLMQNQ